MRFNLNTRFVMWWSIAWALGLMAVAPIVNYFTPFLNSAYNNQWTPDVYWRLVLYWHGALFMPWVTVLACIICTTFKLDTIKGTAYKLIRESIMYGGFIATPLAGIAGIFDVYDRFALGIPLWLQIIAFLIGDEMAIALIVTMFLYPKVSGVGYDKVGLAYYTVLAALIGVLIAAFEGHIGGWITWAGPWPSFVSNYINSTMYSVLGYYNATAVITWTENVVTSHSHTMIPLILAGIVALISSIYGYNEMKGSAKLISAAGFFIMIYMIIAVVWLYIVAGVGNYSIPTLFASGPNGVNGLAMDDTMTGMIGWGALLVLIGTGVYAHRQKKLDRSLLFILIAAALIYLTVPVTGYYIEFHESYFGFATPGQGPGWMYDAAYLRFHQDFGFFLLPMLITASLAFKYMGIEEKRKNLVNDLFTIGSIIAFIFGESYVFTLNNVFLYLAFLGGAITAVGVLTGLLSTYKDVVLI
ncbi:MAG: hypothetical protein OWQ54_00170 [Sulfolobaceae archaeon]|nr:hypothetical protein [Sulfolobaceae archaeon]